MTQPPTVPPVPAGAPRPTWSVMIPVHDCADLLDVALQEVVSQLGGRDDVEIAVVDDMSTDDPESVVARHAMPTLRYVALEQPHGAIPNFNRCVGISRGRLVHLLHGDDGVLPGFYDAMEAAFESGEAAAALCRTQYIDEGGHPTVQTRSERSPSGWWTDASVTLAVSNRVRPAGIVVRRDTYESIGGYRTDLPHAADWDMWARVAAHGPIWFVDEVLSLYRVHEASDTAERIRSGDNVRERIETIDIVAGSLPEAERTSTRRRALAYSVAYAGRTALRCAGRRDLRAAFHQLVAAGQCVIAMFRPRRHRTA